MVQGLFLSESMALKGTIKRFAKRFKLTWSENTRRKTTAPRARNCSRSTRTNAASSWNSLSRNCRQLLSSTTSRSLCFLTSLKWRSLIAFSLPKLPKGMPKSRYTSIMSKVCTSKLCFTQVNRNLARRKSKSASCSRSQMNSSDRISTETWWRQLKKRRNSSLRLWSMKDTRLEKLF